MRTADENPSHPRVNPHTPDAIADRPESAFSACLRDDRAVGGY
jgi:hypothetical protein